MRLLALIFPFLFAIPLSSCELLGLHEDNVNVVLSVDQTAYAPGDTVTLTLSNFGNRTFTVHPTLCPAQLERRTEWEWKPVNEERSCTSVGIEFERGDRITSERTFPDTLTAGRYRFTYELRQQKGGDRHRRIERIVLYTRIFEVED